MYRFPEGYYSDVRIEDVFQTNITVTLGQIEDFRVKEYTAAFIRVFNGRRWFFSSTTNIDSIQNELDRLASMGDPMNDPDDHPMVKRFESNRKEHLEFTGDNDLSRIPAKKKFDDVSAYFPIVSDSGYVRYWAGSYIDQRIVKRFCSSIGADLVFDFQRAGVRIRYELSDGNRRFRDRFDLASNYYHDLAGLEDRISENLQKSVAFLKNAENVQPGRYTVILSPEAAGIFAHESFGHKSEADFMLGDTHMLKEWHLGKKVGSDILSIVDDGNIKSVGYVPYDDEGTKAKETYLIRNGVLSGRLHSAVTAASLEEEPTGNARAVNFEYEPIVRMSTTYIKPGTRKLDELVAEIENGVFVETLNHGSGMSTFTLAPARAYIIKNGEITDPVKISVITGNVFQTLNEIDGLSDDLQILSFALGGCGKMEQYPLPVSFGGPYVRVKNLNVQ